ncbi:MAG: hypothetical protein ABWX90_03355 [Candidatus Saccharimonadales bacterium]
MKQNLNDTIRMFPQAAELRWEYELATLIYPQYSISYDENGHYWKMNDTRVPLPNFKGYVPKWLRDNAAAFQLAVAIRKFPIQLSGGLTICDRTGKQRIVTEMYLDHEFDREHESEKELHERVARLVILKAACFFANTENVGQLF